MKMPYNVLLREYLEQAGDGVNIIAFKEAGDELVDFVAKSKRYSWYEAFLRPIGYLYRHYLELELKYWIKELNKGVLEQAGELLKDHNLNNLWFKQKPLIQPFCVCEEDQKNLRKVEEVILTFNKYDPTGQEFRYLRTTTGMNTLRTLPHRLDVQEIKGLIGKVSFFFDGLGGIVGI